MNKKILLVDDDISIVNIVGHSLKMFGFEVKTFHNPLKALDSLKNEKYDLLITDIMMPQLDGMTLVKQLKDVELNKKIPIVFLSAKVLDEKDKKIIFENKFKYIKKPFMPNQIIEIINKIFNQKNA